MDEYLPYLVLVGGWVPYLYVKHLWKNLAFYPVTTTDVDFGITESKGTPSVKECLYSKLSRLKYKERHIDMGRIFPIVPVVEGPGNDLRLSIEFIAGTGIGNSYLENLIGRQIFVNRLEKFELILMDNISLSLVNRDVTPVRTYILNIPSPHIFLFHKAITFIERDDELKKTKDLYYIYFVLRFHPQIETLLKNIKNRPLHKEKQKVLTVFQKLFAQKISPGCFMVEQENGPDSFIHDIRQDAFERFQNLIENLKE